MNYFQAIIFDRDGVLNRTTQILRADQQAGDATDGYVLHPSELELFPEVKPALALLKQNGLKVFVFTQQNCVGKGLVTEEGVQAVHAHLNTLIAPEAVVEEFYLATHKDHPRAKPNPMMINEILEKYGYAPYEVLVVGDSMRDYKAAKAAETPFVWVRDDLGRVSEEDMSATGCAVFDNVLQVVETAVLK